MDQDVQNLNKIFNASLTNSEFQRLSEFIYNEFGIKMPPTKKIMLQSRLQKRLRHLQMNSYKEYIQYLFSKKGIQEEIVHMIDVVSTNKTDFFREPSHFSFLTDEVLPKYIEKHPVHSQLKIWSAGCSSGEEPYTMAMVLSEFGLRNPAFDFSIFATDISTIVLNKAQTAIYGEDRIISIPMSLKKRYLLRSKDTTQQTIRIVPALRKKVTFRRLNFMDSFYDTPYTFDIVFCRNVLIYFDRQTQEKVINKLCSRLKSGGFFFLGHSESIMNMNVPLKQEIPTVYRKI